MADTSGGAFLEFLHEYCEASHGFIFQHVPYNMLTGMIIFVMSKVTTFTWNFVDLFLMLVSTGLAERFKQFNAVVVDSDVSVSARYKWCFKMSIMNPAYHTHNVNMGVISFA